MASFEDLDTVLRYPYCYRSRSDNHLESVANAHTAADLHVPPRVQYRAGSEIVGAASALRCTACARSRKEMILQLRARRGLSAAPRSSLLFEACGICNENQGVGFAQCDCDIFVEMKKKRHIAFMEARSAVDFSKWCFAYCL